MPMNDENCKKLVEHIVSVKLISGNHLLIHSLRGTMVKLNGDVMSVLEKWKGLDKIIPMNADEFRACSHFPKQTKSDKLNI